MMSGITQSTALWYASRATGIVCLVLLSAVVLLGILVNRQGRLPGLPRFAVTGLHRSLSLVAVVFLGIHVLAARPHWCRTSRRSPTWRSSQGTAPPGSARSARPQNRAA